ncbi:4-aminobutyrate--2-oxoglutarate transaminase [Weizmannia sp. CD-2023]|uniref:4-aminobutyrate--2-oxoglutarate transaminase n=1 Tax=Weizmannia sp. CD-2023 TaxID=3037263 RepID=UPI002E238EED|nr:4-aminobutyrate--2-oxoglutarate transaminase [Weizmannia sp. CD-2023]
MTNANVYSSLPGPLSKELLERREKAVPRGVSNGISAFAKEAKGALVTDVDGNTYIDFAGAIGTLNVGHNHPKVVAAVKEQLERFIHTGFNVMMYEPYIELAEKLAALAPGNAEKKVILLNSGAEAVENAVKISRKYTKRPAIISFTRGFHGRTLMTMSMTSKVKPYKYEFGPFASEVYKAPYPYAYRKPGNLTDEEYEDYMIQEFRNFFQNDVAAETVAAVVMEPVQGEGGFIVPGKKFVKAVYDFCQENGILFVSDEIQAGFSRTGRYFAIEHFDVVPDLITISKSLAAGVPLSGVIGRSDIMDAANPGELGGTYAGSPLGCAASLAVLDIIESEKLNERAEKIGRHVLDTFRSWQKEFTFIGDVRGLGAMCAFEVVKDKTTKEPDKALTKRIVKEANKRGLLLLDAGIFGNVIRILMPIVITDDQLQEGLDILKQSIAAAANVKEEVSLL